MDGSSSASVLSLSTESTLCSFGPGSPTGLQSVRLMLPMWYTSSLVFARDVPTYAYPRSPSLRSNHRATWARVAPWARLMVLEETSCP